MILESQEEHVKLFYLKIEKRLLVTFPHVAFPKDTTVTKIKSLSLCDVYYDLINENNDILCEHQRLKMYENILFEDIIPYNLGTTISILFYNNTKTDIYLKLEVYYIKLDHNTIKFLLIGDHIFTDKNTNITLRMNNGESKLIKLNHKLKNKNPFLNYKIVNNYKYKNLNICIIKGVTVDYVSAHDFLYAMLSFKADIIFGYKNLSSFEKNKLKYNSDVIIDSITYYNNMFQLHIELVKDFELLESFKIKSLLMTTDIEIHINNNPINFIDISNDDDKVARIITFEHGKYLNTININNNITIVINVYNIKDIKELYNLLVDFDIELKLGVTSTDLRTKLSKCGNILLSLDDINDIINS